MRLVVHGVARAPAGPYMRQPNVHVCAHLGQLRLTSARALCDLLRSVLSAGGPPPPVRALACQCVPEYTRDMHM
eukprot:55566-Eustigmatos_ZCMA.PRE.1